MSDLNDIIVRDMDHPYKRGIPAVPTPDWSIESIKANTPTPITSDKVDHAPSSTQETLKKFPTKRPFSMISTPSNSSTVSELLQRPTTSHIDASANENTSTSLSRFIGDVTSSHSFSTPVYKSVNPHSNMVAATPTSGSVVNQAINSIKLQNCVSTVNLGCELDLLDVYCRTRYTEYNPQKFQGVVMKLLEPRATALIFRSGKVVCTGARNEYDSFIAARKFGRIIEKLGFPTKFLDFKIQNFCATADLKFPVRLDALQHGHGQFASYEPELFPGLVYRMVRPRVVLLIFVNGKVVFTGGKNRHEITEALEIIYPVLRGYRIS